MTLNKPLHDRILRALRTVPNFPIAGVSFKDITPILQDPLLFNDVLDSMCLRIPASTQKIAAVESRGFWFAVPLALKLKLPFVPIRKPGKLPYDTHSIDYALEYGSGRLEIHKDAIVPGQEVALIDDVLATGGTLKAAHDLIVRLGGRVPSAHVMIRLGFLHPESRLGDLNVYSLLEFNES